MHNHDFKVAMLTPSVSRSGGGLLDASRRLAQELHRMIGDRLGVFGLEDVHAHDDLASWLPVRPAVFSVQGPRAFGYASGLHGALSDFKPDLLHTVGLWMYPSQVARTWTHRKGIPHLVSPHGMLDPWALSNSRWKKRLAGWLYEQDHLKSAACIHTLCPAEARAVNDLRLGVPLEVIPNGVDLPSEKEPEKLPEHAWIDARLAEGKKILLYLGRLHPKKGLSLLIEAWAALQAQPAGASEWGLVVAGWDQGGYVDELKRMAANIAEHSLWFAGPQYGAAKDALYRRASAFILPSFSEGLPMAVLEAWSYRLPVLMTAECNLEEGFRAGAALKVRACVDDIVSILQKLFLMNDGTRQTMGLQGYELVARQFQWRSVAERMLNLYDRIYRDHRAVR
jgi:glycosyltransferase involved in cell wall biosynthesis